MGARLGPWVGKGRPNGLCGQKRANLVNDACRSGEPEAKHGEKPRKGLGLRPKPSPRHVLPGFQTIHESCRGGSPGRINGWEGRGG